MNKRMFIIENSDSPHETSVISAITIFRELGWDVRVILGRLAHRRLQDFLKKEKVRVYRTFKLKDLIKCLFSISRTDYLYFNTIGLRVIPFALFFSFLTSHNILYIRNASSWFRFCPNPAGLMQRVLAFLLFISKRFLLKRAELLVVGHNNISSYLKAYTCLPIIYVPFNIKKPTEFLTSPGDGRVKIVVPGAVDFQRKNNSVILDAIKLIEPNFLEKFEIVFLGRAVNKFSVEFLESWKSSLKNIVFYTGFIEQSEFDRQLEEADIVMGVINVLHKSKYYTEEYGRTKDTGIEAHAIAYSKPLVVNSDYSTDPYLRSSVVHFSNVEQLRDIIMRSITDRDWLLQIKKNAVGNSRNFEVNALLENIKKVFPI